MVRSFSGIAASRTRATLSHAAHAGLELEGIFRVAGAKTRMTELVTTLNSGSPIAFHRDENPAIVSSLVKQFLRDLPCPLLTFALYSEFMALAGKPVDEMLANFLQLHAKLPPANQTLLRHLIRLAFIIAQNQDVNRMSESNLAKVIGPNILYSQTEGVNLESINAVNTLLETLIIHYPELFEDKAAAATRWFDDLIPSDAPVRNSAPSPRGTLAQLTNVWRASCMRSFIASCMATPSRFCHWRSVPATRCSGAATREASCASTTPTPSRCSKSLTPRPRASWRC